MAVRVADAMRRGRLVPRRVTGADSIDFLQLDWFALADQPVEELRARFSVRPKSDEAIAAGSVDRLGAGRHQPVPAGQRPGPGRAATADPTSPSALSSPTADPLPPPELVAIAVHVLAAMATSSVRRVVVGDVDGGGAADGSDQLGLRVDRELGPSW